MSNLKFQVLPKFLLSESFVKTKKAIALVATLAVVEIVGIQSALAHHPMGGKLPSNFTEGFLSGLGHPVIGLDHLVFVIAIGLLAALRSKAGLILPVAFVLATAGGTGIHLLGMDLPLPEIIISASILIMGIFLARKNTPNLVILSILGAIAGIFHGYAYGEAIVGAQTTAIAAYLFGFCTIQLLISAIAFSIGRLALNLKEKTPNLSLRFAGFTACGIGGAFLSTTILG